VAGPTERENDFGAARSTLHAWQKQGAVVGLLVGVRKHAFPIEQTKVSRLLVVLAEWRVRKVGFDYHVDVEGHFCSVPYHHARAAVEARLTPRAVESR
jgi:hypothetical protein